MIVLLGSRSHRRMLRRGIDDELGSTSTVNDTYRYAGDRLLLISGLYLLPVGLLRGPRKYRLSLLH